MVHGPNWIGDGQKDLVVKARYSAPKHAQLGCGDTMEQSGSLSMMFPALT